MTGLLTENLLLDTPENPVHLVIQRKKLSRLGTKEVIPTRIHLARQTVFPLMGAELYGLNGLNCFILSAATFCTYM